MFVINPRDFADYLDHEVTRVVTSWQATYDSISLLSRKCGDDDDSTWVRPQYLSDITARLAMHYLRPLDYHLNVKLTLACKCTTKSPRVVSAALPFVKLQPTTSVIGSTLPLSAADYWNCYSRCSECKDARKIEHIALVGGEG